MRRKTSLSLHNASNGLLDIAIHASLQRRLHPTTSATSNSRQLLLFWRTRRTSFTGRIRISDGGRLHFSRILKIGRFRCFVGGTQVLVTTFIVTTQKEKQPQKLDTCSREWLDISYPWQPTGLSRILGGGVEQVWSFCLAEEEMESKRSFALFWSPDFADFLIFFLQARINLLTLLADCDGRAAVALPLEF